MSIYRQPSFIERQVVRLYQGSIVHRFTNKFKYKGKCLLPEDSVKALNGRPLGMFFYNLRAIFLGSGLVFIISLGLWLLFLPSNREMRLTVIALAVAWVIDAGVTLFLHKSFIKDLAKWTQQINPSEFPPLFNRYFVLDSIVVFLLFMVGKIGGVGS